jgi:hypothetical protein
LLGAILIYISFQQQVKETNITNFFKVYDTIVNLIDFTIKQYDALLKGEKVKLNELLKTDKPNKETLKKYRCVLDLVSQCCDCIGKFKVPKTKNGSIDNDSEEYFYKNQLRALFLPHYYLYYRNLFKDSLQTFDIDTKGNDRHFKYKEQVFEIKIDIDVYRQDANIALPQPKHIYFIAAAIKNIIDVMENRSTDDYYLFREISKITDDE